MERILLQWDTVAGSIISVMTPPVFFYTAGHYDKATCSLDQGKIMMAALGYDITPLEDFEDELEQMKAAAKAAK